MDRALAVHSPGKSRDRGIFFVISADMLLTKRPWGVLETMGPNKQAGVQQSRASSAAYLLRCYGGSGFSWLKLRAMKTNKRSLSVLDLTRPGHEGLADFTNKLCFAGSICI